MAEHMTLSIITPEKELFKGEIEKVLTENVFGRMEVLPKHLDMIALLKPTITEFVDEKGTRRKLFTSTGVLTIQEGAIVMSCEAAEWPEDIDKARALEAKNRAESRIEHKEKDIDMKRAEAALYRSLIRLKF